MVLVLNRQSFWCFILDGKYLPGWCFVLSVSKQLDFIKPFSLMFLLLWECKSLPAKWISITETIYNPRQGRKEHIPGHVEECTLTLLVCPSQWAQAIACKAAWGFQSLHQTYSIKQYRKWEPTEKYVTQQKMKLLSLYLQVTKYIQYLKMFH